jgi:hypothetical protein
MWPRGSGPTEGIRNAGGQAASGDPLPVRWELLTEYAADRDEGTPAAVEADAGTTDQRTDE